MEWTSVGMIIQFPTFFWGNKTCSKPPIRWYPPYILDDQITTCGDLVKWPDQITSQVMSGPPGPQPTDRDQIGCPTCKAILTKLSSKPISINLLEGPFFGDQKHQTYGGITIKSFNKYESLKIYLFIYVSMYLSIYLFIYLSNRIKSNLI